VGTVLVISLERAGCRVLFCENEKNQNN
jgi:hypothetical protein